MLILINFHERIRGESRTEYLQRKFTEAHQASIDNDCTVTVEGCFFDSDLTIVNRITNGLQPIKKIPFRGDKYKATFVISANPPRIPRPYEF